jgi:hypothetical protein
VALGELQIPVAELDDADADAGGLKLPIALQPFGNQPIIEQLARLRSVRAEVVIDAVYSDERLAAPAMLAVLRQMM